MKSEFSSGLADKVCGAWDEQGGTPAELNRFAESEALVSAMLAILRGEAVVKPITKSVPPPPEPLWKKISDFAISVNLGYSPGLPFNGAVIEKHIGEGWVPVEKRDEGLYVDGCKVVLHLSKRQQNGKWLKGYELRDELTGKPVLNANILDALYENPHLIPEDWKRDENGNVRYIFFWGTIFRNPDAGNLGVRCLFFYSGSWNRYCRWLDDDWRGCRPTALLAS